MRRGIAATLLGGIALLGVLQAGAGAWIHVKALLAQGLLNRAWEESLRRGGPVPPWPWADTWPVARLYLAGRPDPLLVLEGDSGRTLAFGPGRAPDSARPGEPGTMLISGHRDTHFSALRHLRPGQPIRLETLAGEHQYRVREIRVVDADRYQIADRGEATLALVTCYPLDSPIPGGSRRLLVWAVAVPRERVSDRPPSLESSLPKSQRY
jgi:sortase A